MGDFSPEKKAEKLTKHKLVTVNSFIIISSALVLFIGAMIIRLWNGEQRLYAYAYEIPADNSSEFKILITGDAKDALTGKEDPMSIIQKESRRSAEIAIAGNMNFQEELKEMVGNSPIKKMVPFIAQRNKKVAALLIGIAKKESSFGSASPSKDGQTCFNYWGYKGAGSRGVGMGYACFGSDEEAVRVVGDRIETLVQKELNTPAKMIVWKCGSSCAGHDPASVKKWISDVESYFYRIVQG
jgi:hypothetical protein